MYLGKVVNFYDFRPGKNYKTITKNFFLEPIDFFKKESIIINVVKRDRAKRVTYGRSEKHSIKKFNNPLDKHH